MYIIQFIIPFICMHNTVPGDVLVSTLVLSKVETYFEIFFLISIVILLKNKIKEIKLYL